MGVGVCVLVGCMAQCSTSSDLLLSWLLQVLRPFSRLSSPSLPSSFTFVPAVSVFLNTITHWLLILLLPLLLQMLRLISCLTQPSLYSA
jgi:hypothetical protein